MAENDFTRISGKRKFMVFLYSLGFPAFVYLAYRAYTQPIVFYYENQGATAVLLATDGTQPLSTKVQPLDFHHIEPALIHLQKTGNQDFSAIVAKKADRARRNTILFGLGAGICLALAIRLGKLRKRKKTEWIRR